MLHSFFFFCLKLKPWRLYTLYFFFLFFPIFHFTSKIVVKPTSCMHLPRERKRYQKERENAGCFLCPDGHWRSFSQNSRRLPASRFSYAHYTGSRPTFAARDLLYLASHLQTWRIPSLWGRVRVGAHFYIIKVPVFTEFGPLCNILS